MLYRNLTILLAFLIAIGTAGASDWEPRAEAIKNLGSGYAAMVLCSTHGHANTELIARLGEVYQSRMTRNGYEAFRDQYQRSLTEKTVYSIANRRWVAFQINEHECATMDRSAQLYLERLAPGAP